MNKVELISQIAEKTGTTKKASGEVLDAVIAVISETIASGEDVKISGFGSFTVSERAARTGRNPMTGDSINIPASKSPKFKAAKALKESVNQ